jgi:hypothetical protein
LKWKADFKRALVPVENLNESSLVVAPERPLGSTATVDNDPQASVDEGVS